MKEACLDDYSMLDDVIQGHVPIDRDRRIRCHSVVTARCRTHFGGHVAIIRYGVSRKLIRVSMLIFKVLDYLIESSEFHTNLHKRANTFHKTYSYL
jgi:hypothetical protein